MTVILASTSAIRRQLLEQAGVAVTAVKPPLDEEQKKRVIGNLSPAEIAEELARAKALSVADISAENLVIGADQVLDLGGSRLDKPQTLAEARQQLLALRGRRHELISAIACAREGRIVWSHVAVAELSVRSFSETFLDHYLKALGSTAVETVGAYKLEGLGAQLFDGIRGDYFTILGLPLLPLLGFLRQSGELPA